MENQTFAVGDRVEKLCATCGVVRGHVVASMNKYGRISRVSCPNCGLLSIYKKGADVTSGRPTAKTGTPYDQTQTYRRGQTLMHPTFGLGEVTAIIEPQKMDVLFPDRIRRLIHSRVQA